MVIALGGGAFAYRNYKQNLDTQIWLPMPINQERPVELREKTVKVLKQKLSDPVLLAQVSQDVGLVKKMRLVSDEEVAKDLAKRLFVEIGTADTARGKVPSINIGFNCKVKEFGMMSDVVNRLRKDIFKILGIPQPKNEEF